MNKTKSRKVLDSKLGGPELLDRVISLTGLPERDVQRELEHIFDKTGQNLADLTLEQLRDVVAAYLEQVHLEFQEK